MAQVRPLFNGSRLAEGIFYDLKLPLPVHHGEIKTDIGELSFGLSREEFGRGRNEPVHLFAPEPRRCAGETGAFLDLNKDDLWAVTENQIDFAALPAPTGRRDDMIAPFVITRDDIFGGKPRMI